MAALFDAELAPPPGREPEARRRRAGRRRDRGPRAAARATSGGCSATSRIGPSPSWLKARLHRRRHAPDLERRRRDELRHARARQPAARLRLRRRSRAGGSSSAARGRARSSARSTERERDARRGRPRDRRRRRGRSRSPGSWAARRPRSPRATTTVLLEAANFEPIGILRTSERLALRTEALEPLGEGRRPVPRRARPRLATELLVELAGARWAGDATCTGGCRSGRDRASGPSAADARRRARRSPPDGSSAASSSGSASRSTDELGRSPCRPGAPATSRREIDWSRRSRASASRTIPFTLPARREMFGRLTQEQRLRRHVEDVLVGCGFSEAYTSSLAASDPDPRALRLPEPLSAEQARPPHDAPAGPRRGGAAQRRRGQRGDRAVRDRARLPAVRRAAPEERLARRRASPRAASAGRRASSRRSSRALQARAALRASAERLHPGKARRQSRPLREAAGSASSTRRCSRVTWGVFELDLDDALRRVPERVALRGRDHLPGGPAGPRLRRGRGRGRRRRSSTRPARRRRGAPRGAGLRRLPRRADRRGQKSVAFASPSSRRSERSPTRTPRCCGSGSSRRSRALRRRAPRGPLVQPVTDAFVALYERPRPRGRRRARPGPASRRAVSESTRSTSTLPADVPLVEPREAAARHPAAAP